MSKSEHAAFHEVSCPDLFGGMPSAPIPQAPCAQALAPEPDDRLSHRSRLRLRFMEGGAAAMPDYELLELVLFRALPRGDVKPLAKRLLRTFGDINRVMAAAPDRLTEVKGVGPGVVEQLKILEAVGHRMARATVLQRPILSSWDDLMVYLKTAMSHLETERFRVLYLDRKNVLIADEELGRGTVDHVPVYPREIMRRALTLGASALILVHNHPSGDPTPSETDVTMTHLIRDAAQTLGIVIHDHIVVGKTGEVSFRSEGIL